PPASCRARCYCAAHLARFSPARRGARAPHGAGCRFRRPELMEHDLSRKPLHTFRDHAPGSRSTASGRDAVIPGAFAYHRPQSVNEAVGLLADVCDNARALAGGHSLIPMMKLRLATPADLVDLGGIADLK